MITAQKAAITRNLVWMASGASGGGTRSALDLDGSEEGSVCGDMLPPILLLMVWACLASWSSTAEASEGVVVVGEAKGGEGRIEWLRRIASEALRPVTVYVHQQCSRNYW